ncbi:hypothetical protein BD779DRAFT_1474656 [Infundibulicybe gibba]|nr:hypothetical protein BD779DRAFT_1474656 [Infundibulicybe gibba]
MARTALTTFDAYWIFVTGFGDTSMLMSVGRMYWIYSPLIGGILVIATHIHSAHRISLLYNSRTLGFIITADWRRLFICESRHYMGPNPITAWVWTVMCSLCNIAITILRVFWLFRWRCTGSKTTRTIVARLLWLTLETGVVLTALGITGLVLLVNHPEQPYFIMLTVVIPKCHSVTWFALLNNRTSAQGLEESIPITDIRFQTVSTGMQTGTRPRTPVPATTTIDGATGEQKREMPVETSKKPTNRV